MPIDARCMNLIVGVLKVNLIKVIAPGMLSTFQDLGRQNYQQFGMPVAGSMDKFAHKTANLLVGNDEAEAVLEMTIMGASLEFEEEAVIALTGADMSPKINGEISVGMWRSVHIKRGDKLSFGNVTNGCRCYMAISGGYDILEVLDSKSTYTRGGIGGYFGRGLKKGDVIGFNKGKLDLEKLLGRFIRAAHIPSYSNNIELRVILGPQEEAFTQKGIADFVSETYKISNECDRMGYRLDGKKIEHVASADVISDGIVSGAVQVPAHGNPIIMLSDCQTTGGYTKIAHVITSDLPKIAQSKAGDEVRFKAIDVDEAHSIYLENIKLLEQIKEELNQMKLVSEKNMRLRIFNKLFDVKVNEIL